LTRYRFAAAAAILIFPGYYFMNSDRAPGQGQAAIKEHRRAGGAGEEYRDPKDSPVKTLEDKKKRDAGQSGVDVESQKTSDNRRGSHS
jgi:hypothetical protein